MKNSLVPIKTEPIVNWNGAAVPPLVAAAGESASMRFLDYSVDFDRPAARAACPKVNISESPIATCHGRSGGGRANGSIEH